MDQINLEKAIIETKKLMTEEDNDLKPFTAYSPFYFHTNENLKKCLGNLDFNKERALSVMASGDQTFNLIYLGVKQIDTFDVNVLTYFVYHLRRAIFLAYGFERSSEIEDLFWFSFTNPKKLLDILITLRSFMSDDVYIFFEEILKYNSFLAPNDGYNSFYDLCRDVVVTGSNLYDVNQHTFRQLQDNLDNATLTFKSCEIEDLFLDDVYDLMYFSNISEYFIKQYGKEKFKELMMHFYSHLNSKGIIINYYFKLLFRCPFRDLDKMGFEGKTHIRRLDLKNAVVYSEKC